MTFGSVLLSILWLILIPVAVGSAFDFGRGKREKICWSWLFGQLLLWSAFQAIAVFEVKKGNSFPELKKIYLMIVMISVAVSLLITLIRALIRKKKGESVFGEKDVSIASYFEGESKVKKVLSILSIVIILTEMVLLVVLSYADGDDSYYVAETTMTAASDKMYFALPYTGREIPLDIRHSFAPFPTWLAFISVITGTVPVSMAHVMFPVISLPVTYLLYALMGKEILEEKRSELPVYMFFTTLLVLFGFYSYMTPEKFLLTRLRQGKATLASLVIPMIMMCLYMVLKSLRDDKKTDFRIYILLFMLNTAGCLCSSLGAVLCAVPPVLCALFSCIMYRKFRHVLPLLASCVPCVLMAAFLRFAV